MRRKAERRPSPARVVERLNYDASSGKFTWKYRPELEGTKAAGWNSRYAGVSAGTIDRDGYLVIAINKQRHPAHILAWVIGHGEWPEADLDHINAQKGDNRLVNLRKATVAQNGWNVGLIRRNTSGVKHVSWNAAAKKWQVKIRANGKDNYFGIHDDFDLACVIAHEARAALHGEFARGGTL